MAQRIVGVKASPVCWAHKTANVLSCPRKSKQPQAKRKLHETWVADQPENPEKAFDHFL